MVLVPLAELVELSLLPFPFTHGSLVLKRVGAEIRSFIELIIRVVVIVAVLRFAELLLKVGDLHLDAHGPFDVDVSVDGKRSVQGQHAVR